MSPTRRAPASEASPRRAKPASRRKDGDATRDKIHDAALTLIRRKGFDATTMREIAQAANVSLGLAYHYFENKEALALAFYGDHITRHDEVARRALASLTGLGERIEAALLTGLDVRAADRPVLLVMARTVLDAANPISLFSAETRALRERSIGLFREVASVPEVDAELREPLALALWALHLAVLLRFVHDGSPGQKETRLLIAGASRLAGEVAGMLSLPFLQPMRDELVEVLRQGGVLPRGLSAHPDEGPTHGTKLADASLESPTVPADPAPRGERPRRRKRV